MQHAHGLQTRLDGQLRTNIDRWKSFDSWVFFSLKAFVRILKSTFNEAFAQHRLAGQALYTALRTLALKLRDPTSQALAQGFEA